MAEDLRSEQGRDRQQPGPDPSGSEVRDPCEGRTERAIVDEPQPYADQVTPKERLADNWSGVARTGIQSVVTEKGWILAVVVMFVALIGINYLERQQQGQRMAEYFSMVEELRAKNVAIRAEEMRRLQEIVADLAAEIQRRQNEAKQ